MTTTQRGPTFRQSPVWLTISSTGLTFSLMTTALAAAALMTHIGGCHFSDRPDSAQVDAILRRLRPASQAAPADGSPPTATPSANPQPLSMPASASPPPDVPPSLAAILPDKWTPIDLPTVLKLAGANNLEIAIVEQSVAEVRARELASVSAFLPTFVPGYQYYGTQGRNQNRRGQVFDSTYQGQRLWGRAELQLNPAQAFAETLAARYERFAADASVQSTTNNATLQAALGYHDLAEAVLVVGAAEELRDQTRELVRVAQERVNQGLGLQVDLTRAVARDAEATQFLAEAVTDFRLASIHLARSLQLAIDATLFPAQPNVMPAILLDPDIPLAELLTRTRSNHPTLREQALKILAAEKSLDATVYEGLAPRFFVQSNVGGFGSNAATFDFFQDATAGVFLSLQGLGLTNVARVRASQARLRQSELRAQDMLQLLEAQVASFQEQARLQRGLISTTESQVAAAQESFRLAQQRLKAGTGLVLDLLDAQAQLLRARLGRVRAVVRFNKAQHRLLNAVGLGQ